MKRKYQDQLTKISRHKIAALVIISSLVVSLTSCKKDKSSSTDLVGDWVSLSSFAGKPRYDAVVFTIGNAAYVGLGYNGEDRLQDFWKYDPDMDSWTQVDNYIGVGRSGAVAFSVDGKGYVGLGYDGKSKLNDFYSFDPTQPKGHQWDTVDNFGGTARYGAVAFALGNAGYVGTGYDDYYRKDFWKFDPTQPRGQQWSEIANFRGEKRLDAAAFVIGSKAYLVTGVANANYWNDFYEFDPTADTVWKEKGKITDALDDSEVDDDYTSLIGIGKVAFAINGKGYLATGGQGTVGKIVWEYTPETDTWIQKTSMEGTERIDAVGFGLGNRGYVTTGRTSSYYFDDIWGFDPFTEYNESN